MGVLYIGDNSLKSASITLNNRWGSAFQNLRLGHELGKMITKEDSMLTCDATATDALIVGGCYLSFVVILQNRYKR